MEHFLLPWVDCFSMCPNGTALLWPAPTQTFPSGVLVWNTTLSSMPGLFQVLSLSPPRVSRLGLQALAPGGVPVFLLLESTSSQAPAQARTGTGTGLRLVPLWLSLSCLGWPPLSSWCSISSWIGLPITDWTSWMLWFCCSSFEHLKKATLIIHSLSINNWKFTFSLFLAYLYTPVSLSPSVWLVCLCLKLLFKSLLSYEWVSSGLVHL